MGKGKDETDTDPKSAEELGKATDEVDTDHEAGKIGNGKDEENEPSNGKTSRSDVDSKHCLSESEMSEKKESKVEAGKKVEVIDKELLQVYHPKVCVLFYFLCSN